MSGNEHPAGSSHACVGRWLSEPPEATFFPRVCGEVATAVLRTVDNKVLPTRVWGGVSKSIRNVLPTRVCVCGEVGGVEVA